MRRAYLVAVAVVVGAPAAWSLGCSTSNVHPSTYGDCLDERICARAPTTGAKDGGGDGSSATDEAKAKLVKKSECEQQNHALIYAATGNGGAIFWGTANLDFPDGGAPRYRFIHLVPQPGTSRLTLPVDDVAEPPGVKRFEYYFHKVDPGKYLVALEAFNETRYYNGTTAGTLDPAKAVVLELPNDDSCFRDVYLKAVYSDGGAAQPSDAGDGGPRDASGG